MQPYAQRVHFRQLPVLRWSWSYGGIEIPYSAQFPLPISQPNPIKTRNPAPTSNRNSHFPPLFSAQIPNITAKKMPNPASRQTYWGPSGLGGGGGKFTFEITATKFSPNAKLSNVWPREVWQKKATSYRFWSSSSIQYSEIKTQTFNKMYCKLYNERS